MFCFIYEWYSWTEKLNGIDKQTCLKEEVNLRQHNIVNECLMKMKNFLLPLLHIKLSQKMISSIWLISFKWKVGRRDLCWPSNKLQRSFERLLGNHKVPNFWSIVKKCKKYKQMWVQHEEKDLFSVLIRTSSQKTVEMWVRSKVTKFHLGIKDIKKRYQGRWNRTIMVD